jgi:predicted metal-binding protein
MECQTDFKAIKHNQRFCSVKCKNVFHGKEKAGGIILTLRLRDQLQSLAQAHGVPINEMACMIFNQAMNPDGRPLSDEEIYGKCLEKNK